MAFTNKVIDGGDILLSVGGAVVGCATTHSIELTNDSREISCKGSGSFKSSEYSRFSWTVSVDALFSLYEGDGQNRYPQLMDLFLRKQIVQISSEYVEGSDTFTLQGQAIIQTISKNAPDAENSSFSVSLMGRGELGMTGTNLWEIAITATGADYVFVEETGRVYAYTAGLIILATDGTYNIMAYEGTGMTNDRDAVTVDGANTTLTLTLA